MKNSSTREKREPLCSEHEWVVFSTCSPVVSDTGSEGRCLLVQCTECYAAGAVLEPSLDEWQSETPYRWHDDSRVGLLGHLSKPYVIKRAPRKATKRLSEDALITAFHRWLESGRPESVEVDGQRHESRHLCKVLRRCDRCLPEDCCESLGIPRFSTYGDAVRHLAAA
jgi:hypothetical protein